MTITRDELKSLIKEELSRADVSNMQNPSKSQDEMDLYHAIKEASRHLESVVGTPLPEYNGVAEQLESACQNIRDALDTLSVRHPTHQTNSPQHTNWDSEVLNMYEEKSE